MYWLLSILIITVMIAVLAIVSSSALPVSLLSIELASISIWPYLLIIAISLIIISQRSISSLPKTATSKPSLQNTLSIFGLFSRASYYLIIITLAIILIIGSGLQALSSQQRAENNKISASMRVQALVTIEGISDSVYDVASNSGYRQVATISYIAPLITELSAEGLDALSVEQLQANSRDNNNAQSLNYKVLLSAYPKITTNKNNLASLNSLQPGDQLLMSLTLAPLATSEEAINNPTGFDSYRWLRGRHIDGVANILSVGTPIANVVGSSNTIDGSNPNDSSIQLSVQTLTQSSGLLATAYPSSYLERLRIRIDQGRWQLRQSFYQHWPLLTPAQQQARAVTLSLLTGDRSLINRETKDLYQLAGISHLLAISGTHVLFLAIMLAGLAVLIFNRFRPTLYSYIPRWQVRWGVMISAAFIYALFTGFDVPAARTAWMLLAIGAVRLTLLPVSTMRVLLALAVVMAWVDPYVLWQAGYWLSFVAVALILKYDNSLQQQSTNSSNNRSQLIGKQKKKQSNSIIYTSFLAAWPLIKRLFKLQCWLFIALLPITLLLFGKASLWGLAINLFAIGLFGWVIVPLNLLAGLCYLLLPSVAASIWALVSSLVASLHQLITWLTGLPALNDAWLYTPINTAILLMALLALLPWLLPRGLFSRWLALPPLSLLIMTVYANQQTLTLTPTLYVLPTNDSYVTAAILQYPVDASDTKGFRSNDKSAQQRLDSISWLVLADHRPKSKRTMASSLTADKLSATVEQQLRTLSIKRLEGIVVQTSSTELLSLTAMQLSQSLPTKHYWQAGNAKPTANKPMLISTQNCSAGKAWQSATGELSIQAITGWSAIEDSSVWDCSLVIDSDKPIRILQYNAANPMQSLPLASQILTGTVSLAKTPTSNGQAKQKKSQLVLDVATHQRLWQLWQLMCTDDELAANTGNPINTNSINDQRNYLTTWLTHSTSTVPSAVLTAQQVNQVISYDNKSLEAAFALNDDIDVNTDIDIDNNVIK